jgi:hypothetical protein
MPIKKRTNVPKVPSQPHPSHGKPNHDNLIPLEYVLKEHNRKASDAAWDGDEDMAVFHEEQAAEIRQRIAEGEVWEILN